MINIQEAFDQVLTSIKAGDLDPQLPLLRGALNMRVEAINRTKGYSLVPGDVVVFNSKTHPRYLIGQKARVLDVNQVTAWCEMLNPSQCGKFGRAERIRVPFGIIDKTE